ncbi:MAG: hypothetical protein S4CHLAM123_11220 [Chlamydiales bacterium]|nr:hypothetical protein [Chlamydiales bacterium]
MRWGVLVAVALLFSSCHRLPLKCRSEYLYPPFLASSHVKTPDPYRKCFYGQQIVVRWNLHKERLASPIELHLHVRYGNREMETIQTWIEGSKGYWVYQLVNCDYWCREGILAYQVELIQDGCVIEEWANHLWAELIHIEYETIE